MVIFACVVEVHSNKMVSADKVVGVVLAKSEAVANEPPADHADARV